MNDDALAAQWKAAIQDVAVSRKELEAAKRREMDLWAALDSRTTCSMSCNCDARKALAASDAGLWIEQEWKVAK